MNLEWFEWTRHNLQRGCSPAEIKSILKKNGFTDHAILLAMSCKSAEQWQRGQLPDEAAPNPVAPAGNEQGHPDYKALSEIRLLSDPRIQSANVEGVQLYSIPDFLSRDECEALVSVINSKLRPSTITSGEDKSGFRTSRTCDLGDRNSKIVAKVDKKIANTMGIRLSWSEMIQGQKYEIGQEFKAHTDYFEPGTEEFDTYASELGQRTWTFMIYLNNTQEGGQTYFKDLDISVEPKAGTAVIWNNLKADGTPNPRTIHHGMPVIQGKKLIITKWFRAKGKGTMCF